MGTVLVWLLFALLGILVLVIITPLRLELALNKEAQWRFYAVLRLFGGLGPPIRLRKGEQKSPKTKKKKKKSRPSRLLKGHGYASGAAQLLVALWHCFHIRFLRLDAHFGLGDPGETGQLYGLLTPIIYGAAQGRDISVLPVFDERCLRGTAAAEVSFTPAALVVPFVRFGWHVFGPSR